MESRLNPLNLCSFVDADTAQQTIDELDQDATAVELAAGVTLHAGTRYGEPCIVVATAGAGDLSAVISPHDTGD